MFPPALLPKLLEDSFPDEKDPVFSVVKFVGFTSDDILVHCPDSFSINSTVCSVREQIPIDVLTRHSCRRLTHLSSQFSHDSLGLDNFVLNNSKVETFCVSDDRQLKPDLLYSAEAGGDNKQKNSSGSKDGPSPEQMLEAREKLEQLVRNFFLKMCSINKLTVTDLCCCKIELGGRMKMQCLY